MSENCHISLKKLKTQTRALRILSILLTTIFREISYSNFLEAGGVGRNKEEEKEVVVVRRGLGSMP